MKRPSGRAADLACLPARVASGHSGQTPALGRMPGPGGRRLRGRLDGGDLAQQHGRVDQHPG